MDGATTRTAEHPVTGVGAGAGAAMSLATVCLSGTLEDKLRAAAAAGFDAVEVFEPDLVACPLPPADVRRLAADLGLAVALAQPFRDPDSTDPAAVARTRERLRRKARTARALGTDLLLVCSAVGEDAVGDDDRLAGQLAALADVAREEGVRLAYEALAWGRHVADYRHSLRVVRAAGHEHLGVCLDSFHVLSRGDDTAGLADVRGEEVFFLQLADAPRLSMDVLPWSRHFRCFPGQGDLDVAGFTAAVLATGYAGPLSLEVFNDVFRQTDPRRTAVDGLRSLRRLADVVHRSAGDGSDGGDGGGPRREVVRAAVRPLPAAPAPAGWAFTEVAAPGPVEAEASELLQRLGFAREGLHRSAPVTLWRNGPVRVVVNARAAGAQDAAGGTGGARISALGLRTPQPVALEQRARRLLAPVVARPVGPGEADIPSLEAPDGTWLQFCPPDDSWLGDFTAAPPAVAHGPVLTGVDHVALPQRFGEFDTASLFFQAVVGLEALPGTEVAGPHGLVRSRALTDPAADLSVVLNVGPSGAALRGRAVVAGHVAFRTPDAVAAARAVAAGGGRLLAVPGNYYDDLADRYGLEAERLAQLREASVLYERDADGELLHFYTASLTGGLFVEVVQRTGTHRGFGGTDAAVRLAAQSRWSA
ncbi:sugar phosphate isomerase/epimerase and 4-hydroxyphenylpyruvate domain-containing protein [Kineococcus terrestris]|uniref:sugar phosphate isomerase/epimerase and 4-hydroxyphenylpyruvate domain-containing protein n=1 Tax=Kineococcus terrestris TaxID=2044856 RepID=UPI0034DB54D8